MQALTDLPITDGGSWHDAITLMGEYFNSTSLSVDPSDALCHIQNRAMDPGI